GRSLPELGFAWPAGWGAVVAVGMVVLIAGVMSAQLIALPKHPDVHEAVRGQLEGAAPFLPRTPTEQHWFSGVAITAGVCEEILFRGFCVAYVAAWTGLPGAVAITSVVFGLGHLYQGRSGALKTGVAGLIAGTIFVLGGTLWLPMALHVFVDLHGGLVYRIVRR
ncbi:MAG: CPBP family intramembrane glutamic endopeptidase, partial [Myxococcota bacterium]